jgi:ATP adenylyltransferase
MEPGILWDKVTKQTEFALSCGALHPIPTKCENLEQDGIRFLVRIVSNLVRKDEAKQKQDKATDTSGKDFNPFLPYEQDLFVADISDTHVCLLNKFNIVDHHLLIITREFEEQENLLTLQDFEAMWACLAQIDGLVFYNAGQAAGASQRHKHLQLIPLPLTPLIPPANGGRTEAQLFIQEGVGGEVSKNLLLSLRGSQIPIEPIFASAIFEETVGTIPIFAFKHAIAQLDPHSAKSPLEAASATLKCYHSLLNAVGLQPDIGVKSNKQSTPYNLLATREWMLIVPRSQERFESISINSLGFAGAMLVRNEQQMQILKDYGPMTALKSVAVPVA